MDGYYVVGVIAIPYPRFGVIIKIVSKKDNAYHATIGDIPQRTCTHAWTSQRFPLMLWKIKVDECSTNTFTMFFQVFMQGGR